MAAFQANETMRASRLEFAQADEARVLLGY